MEQLVIDQFDFHEAPGIGGPARVDIHVRAGDYFSMTLEFDGLPDPTDFRVEFRDSSLSIIDPALAFYTNGAGVTVDYVAKTATLLVPALKTLEWEPLTTQITWGWAAKSGVADPETILNGLVYVSSRTVAWP